MSNDMGFGPFGSPQRKDDTRYYYVAGIMGMKANGGFTRDLKQWIVFESWETSQRPYGSTKKGEFVPVDKYW